MKWTWTIFGKFEIELDLFDLDWSDKEIGLGLKFRLK